MVRSLLMGVVFGRINYLENLFTRILFERNTVILLTWLEIRLTPMMTALFLPLGILKELDPWAFSLSLQFNQRCSYLATDHWPLAIAHWPSAINSTNPRTSICCVILTSSNSRRHFGLTFDYQEISGNKTPITIASLTFRNAAKASRGSGAVSDKPQTASLNNYCWWWYAARNNISPFLWFVIGLNRTKRPCHSFVPIEHSSPSYISMRHVFHSEIHVISWNSIGFVNTFAIINF